jgi:hypothetical protein
MSKIKHPFNARCGSFFTTEKYDLSRYKNNRAEVELRRTISLQIQCTNKSRISAANLPRMTLKREVAHVEKMDNGISYRVG